MSPRAVTAPGRATPGPPGTPGDTRPVLDIGLIGPLRVVRSGRVVTPSPPKLRQLLSLLAVAAGRVVRIETITDELWGAPPSERTSRTVQTYVSQLRKVLAGPPGPDNRRPVTIDHAPRVGYRLTCGPGADLDLTRLRRLAGAAGDGDPRAAVVPLRAALELCRGPVLADVRLGPVLAEHRIRLDADRVGVLNRYLRALLELGDPAAVVDESARVEAEDSCHEELYAHLVVALSDVGRRAEAVELFHRVRRSRVDRTGIEPGAALHEAFQRALAARPVQMAPARPAAAPAQLPVDPHPFLGREAQTAAAGAALRAPRHGRAAVLAVVGGPGSGRSAFALRVAERAAADHPDGQLYTDLRDGPAEALAGFLRALGAEVPAGRNERIRAFRAATAGRRILVLADDVTGVDEVAALVPGSALGTLVLTSSIRPAADPRTTVLELPRLSPPEQAELVEHRLGPARVAAEPDAVRDVLRRCGGLPLALNATLARALMRPHWSLARVAAAGPPPAVAGLDLHASVRRCLAQLTDSERAGLAVLAAEPAAGPVPVRRAAALLGVGVDAAEQLLERLVEIRLADPVDPAADRSDHAYRVDAVYREVVVALDRPVGAA